MKLEQLTPETQETIKNIATKNGITTGDVLEYFDALFSGREVSIHSRVFTA